MLADCGAVWEDLSTEVRQGSYISREQRKRTVSFLDGRDGKTKTLETVGMEWVVEGAPVFDETIFTSWR